MIFIITLKDIEVIEGRKIADGTEAEIRARVHELYDFLPPSAKITVTDELVTIDIPDQVIENTSEVQRLKEKAAQRARQGDYAKAVGIWNRVLELDPSNVVARRDLGMAHYETGDIEQAKEHLIEAAVLDPTDAWSFVVLGNIMVRYDKNLEAADRFYRKALELKPNDGWALNSLGGIALEQERWDDAQAWFDRSIASNPKFANPYYGKSHAFVGKGEPDAALASTEQLFRDAEMQDARSKPVFDAARSNYLETRKALAQLNFAKGDEALSVYQEQIEDLSGFPIKIERRPMDAMLAGQTQMSWKHKRDHHLIIMRSQYPAEAVQHIQAHELTHIALEAEARNARRNKWFSTTAETRERAIRSMADDIKKLERRAGGSDRVANVVVQLLSGACGFIFNAPLDIVIEHRIRDRLPDLKHSQYASLCQLASEAEYVTTRKEIREMTPRLILKVNDTLNGVAALWLRSFTGGIADYTGSYRKLDHFALSERLFNHFQERYEKGLNPGDEYDLVDEFADFLKVRNWYQWIEDPTELQAPHDGASQGDSSARPQGTTNPELLRSKDTASAMYLLGAMERFDKLPQDKVRQIAFEIGVLGMSGLDYADPSTKYRLNSLPGESFSGLHLMALMHVGFRRVAPEMNPGMGLDAAYEAALALYSARGTKP